MTQLKAFGIACALYGGGAYIVKYGKSKRPCWVQQHP